MGWGLNQNLISGLWDSFTAPIQDWLSQHPLFFWLATHPWWLVAATLAVLFLLSGLLRAIAGFTEQIWIALLRLPIVLISWLWQGTLLLLRRPFQAKPTVVPSHLGNTPLLSSQPSEQPDRLTQVLDRLETLRQEQDQLLQEIKALLQDRSPPA